MRKRYSSDREKLLKFKAEGREFAKFANWKKLLGFRNIQEKLEKDSYLSKPNRSSDPFAVRKSRIWQLVDMLISNLK